MECEEGGRLQKPFTNANEAFTKTAGILYRVLMDCPDTDHSILKNEAAPLRNEVDTAYRALKHHRDTHGCSKANESISVV